MALVLLGILNIAVGSAGFAKTSSPSVSTTGILWFVFDSVWLSMLTGGSNGITGSRLLLVLNDCYLQAFPPPQKQLAGSPPLHRKYWRTTVGTLLQQPIKLDPLLQSLETWGLFKRQASWCLYL